MLYIHLYLRIPAISVILCECCMEQFSIFQPIQGLLLVYSYWWAGSNLSTLIYCFTSRNLVNGHVIRCKPMGMRATPPVRLTAPGWRAH